MTDRVGKTLAAGLVAASLWATPLTLTTSSMQQDQQHYTLTSTVAAAKEMASGSGSRVNKDPESLLRLGLPIKNKEVRHDPILFL